MYHFLVLYICTFLISIICTIVIFVMVLFIIIINNNINTNINYNFIDSSLKIVKRGLKFFFPNRKKTRAYVRTSRSGNKILYIHANWELCVSSLWSFLRSVATTRFARLQNFAFGKIVSN